LKLDPRRVEAFLRDPGACRVALLYGEDSGLVHERAAQLVRAVAGSLDDPFRVAELERDEMARIPEEMAAMSLTGGRRVVRLREAGEAALPFVLKALSAVGDALLVVEAPGLASRGKLRGAVERAAEGMTIACYPQEGRALEQVIRDILAALEVSAEPDALTWLSGQLGADRAVTQREAEKLALYAGRGGRVDLEAARICVGDLAGLSLDDAVFAATAGDVAGTDRALELAMAEGAAPVGVLRACLLHLQRLQRASAAMVGGLSAAQAAKASRPPVFFRREGAFIAALQLWPPSQLQAACVRIWEAERACKRTGAPAEPISRSAVLGLAQRAAAAKRR
jgi:DNA polymerase-3 subunit delta